MKKPKSEVVWEVLGVIALIGAILLLMCIPDLVKL